MKEAPESPELRGKTIAGLIRELQSFEDQTLEVRLSLDAGDTSYPIALVGKKDGRCLLWSYDDAPVLRHQKLEESND